MSWLTEKSQTPSFVIVAGVSGWFIGFILALLINTGTDCTYERFEAQAQSSIKRFEEQAALASMFQRKADSVRAVLYGRRR